MTVSPLALGNFFSCLYKICSAFRLIKFTIHEMHIILSFFFHQDSSKIARKYQLFFSRKEFEWICLQFYNLMNKNERLKNTGSWSILRCLFNIRRSTFLKCLLINFIYLQFYFFNCIVGFNFLLPAHLRRSRHNNVKKIGILRTTLQSKYS